MSELKMVERIWICGHTKKCRWAGSREQLIEVPRKDEPRVCDQTCPRCGNNEFFIRDVTAEEFNRLANQTGDAITILDAKWLDPECHNGCKSLIFKEAALARAERAESTLRHIAHTYCGVTIGEETNTTFDDVPSFVEGQIDKQSDRADKAEAKATTLETRNRQLVQAMGKALPHFITRCFCGPEYKCDACKAIALLKEMGKE